MAFPGLKNHFGNQGVWFVLSAAILWGTTGTSQGLAPEGVQPAAIGAMRLAIGGMCLLILAVYRKRLFNGRRWPLASTAASVIFVAAYQICFFAGVAKTGVAVGTVVAIGSSPIAAGLLGWIIRKERLGRKWYAATGLSVSGCILLITASDQLSVNLPGILLALGAGFSYAAYTVGMKALLDSQSPDAVTAVVFSLAAILLAPVLFTSDLSWVAQPEGLAIVMHLGILATALSYWLFARGLQTVFVGTAATLTLAEPLTAALLGLVVLGERLAPLEIAGICLLFAGIALLAIGPRAS